MKKTDTTTQSALELSAAQACLTRASTTEVSSTEPSTTDVRKGRSRPSSQYFFTD